LLHDLKENFGEGRNTSWVTSSSNLKPQNSLEKEESQIMCLYLKNTKNSKATKIEGLPTGFEGQDHQEKRHTNLMCDSQHKSRKQIPLKPSHENPKKKL
jgi:hypothetical protein